MSSHNPPKDDDGQGESAERQLRKRSIGAFLREQRVKANLSQSDVSTRLGYTSAQFISNWERGIALPPLDVLPLLAEYFGISSRLIIKVMIQYQEELHELKAEQLAEAFRRHAKS